ncbi:MAG TPA: toxin-antitoxin system YwqK family antitoxin [Cytophagales bacterium]|nr:toxin-antitoxin system YwqK family antitoxin [Cytophagales bacterium]
MDKIFFMVFFILTLISCAEKKEISNYYDSGNIKSKGEFINGEKVGWFYEYYENGNLKSKSFWKEGFLNGKGINYFENGQVSIISHWKNGQQDGEAKEFSEIGRLTARSFYKDDKLVGDVFFYDVNGNLIERQLYNNDGYLIYYSKFANNRKVDESILPFYKSKADTISLGENYEVNICLGIKLEADVKIYLGELDAEAQLIDTIEIVESDDNVIFHYSEKPVSAGKNAISGIFFHEENSIDSTSITGYSFKHGYYVK